MFDIFSEGYTMFVVACGAGLLGAISGLMGTFALLKRQSLLADAVSHASLPGIVFAFILTGTNSHPALMAGALVAGGAAAIQFITLVTKAKLRQDSSLSLLLSVYFAFGMVLLSFVQHRPEAAQAGVESFLYGQAATMLVDDVRLIACIGLVILYIFFILGKEFLMVAFDPQYANAAGFSSFKLDVLFVVLLVATVVAGLQMVGVVLMSAMIVTPAAAARQWSNRLRTITILSVLFGAGASIIGSIISSSAIPLPSGGKISGLPTGPTIVVCAGLIAAVSFIFGKKNGLFWRLRTKKLALEAMDFRMVLKILYKLSLQHKDLSHAHPLCLIARLCPNSEQFLAELSQKGLAIQAEKDKWAITPEGKRYVEEYLP